MAISISIDATKIDKSRLKTHPNGAKYLDLTLIPTPDSKFGDHFMVVHSSNAREREDGYKSEILGNGKDWDRVDQSPQSPALAPQSPSPSQEDDDIPF